MTTNRVQPATGVEPENRDPNELNDHIIVDFYSVFGEPENTRSFDCVWEFSEVFYDCFRECSYKLATLCCGVCIAISWGIEFVPVVFASVWCWTPCNSLLYNICTLWCKTCCLIQARCLIAPVCKSCAFFFHHCGDGNLRAESPVIFPKSKRRPRPPPEPKPEVQSAEPEKKIIVAPVPVRVSTNDYDKEKTVRSVKRQMMLF